MDWVNHLTYIDVLITPQVKGGRPGLAVAVAEPSTCALVSVVLLGAAAAFYRRRKKDRDGVRHNWRQS